MIIGIEFVVGAIDVAVGALVETIDVAVGALVEDGIGVDTAGVGTC